MHFSRIFPFVPTDYLTSPFSRSISSFQRHRRRGRKSDSSTWIASIGVLKCGGGGSVHLFTQSVESTKSSAFAVARPTASAFATCYLRLVVCDHRAYASPR